MGELFIKLHPVMTIVYIQLTKTISYIAHYLVTTITVVLIKFDEHRSGFFAIVDKFAIARLAGI